MDFAGLGEKNISEFPWCHGGGLWWARVESAPLLQWERLWKLKSFSKEPVYISLVEFLTWEYKPALQCDFL